MVGNSASSLAKEREGKIFDFSSLAGWFLSGSRNHFARSSSCPSLFASYKLHREREKTPNFMDSCRCAVCRRAEHKPGVLELSWMLDCELEHTYFGMQNQKLISSRALGQYLGLVIFSSSCSKICLSSFVEL